jgi:hypothetical protein
MREIKFRAWDKQNKRMVEVVDIRLTEMTIMVREDEEAIPYELQEGEYEGLFQFTGLLDRRGREVYEGYILRDSFGDNSPVRFEPSCALYIANDSALDKHFTGTCEVTGNIYENPTPKE